MKNLHAVLEQVRALGSSHLLITIDGPCGSGKSTLAQQLFAALGAPVVHMDDFVIPHAQKTPERLSEPGGNADVGRLLSEVLQPWLARQPFAYRPYLCHEDAFGAPVSVPSCPLLILEGSYCGLPKIAEHAGLRLFLRVSPEVQQRRLLQRVGPERLVAFNERWIPLENAYFSAFGLPDAGCIVLDS